MSPAASGEDDGEWQQEEEARAHAAIFRRTAVLRNRRA
jgi:hypothetical protein